VIAGARVFPDSSIDVEQRELTTDLFEVRGGHRTILASLDRLRVRYGLVDRSPTVQAGGPMTVKEIESLCGCFPQHRLFAFAARGDSLRDRLGADRGS
jgi:hypothetical protein